MEQVTCKSLDRLEGVLVRSDGLVYIPGKGRRAHWTYGSKTMWDYRVVTIKGKEYRVHRLVMEAFHGPCPDGMEVDHKNRIRHDNRLENLTYCTHTENMHNTAKYEHVEKAFGVHEADNRYEYHRFYYHTERGKAVHTAAKKRQNALNKNVRFADGSRRYIPNDIAMMYLAIPLSERIYLGGSDNG